MANATQSKKAKKVRLTLWIEPELALKIQQVQEEDCRSFISGTIRYLVILGMKSYFSAKTQT